MDDLYQQALLDLYKNPLNKKPLSDFTIRQEENNPLCGEQVELFVKFDEHDRVTDVGWESEGCSISQVGASLLTDYIKNKTREELKTITSDEVIKMTGLNLNPARLRCLLLCYTALQKILTT
ncbi:MAG: iron-sulfur cluster assembly scaffold protein [Candidatus Magasanikbacteria bacterium]|nr:iron-sulfur cluster assembly scaffold protein [Candidatus Magasanikbacteria bacterium]